MEKHVTALSWPLSLYRPVVQGVSVTSEHRSQQQIIDAAKLGDHVLIPVLAREITAKGARVYETRTWCGAFAHYWGRVEADECSVSIDDADVSVDGAKQRAPVHLYELITEEQPVHPFFDIDIPLDAARPLEPQVAEHAMRCQRFVECVQRVLARDLQAKTFYTFFATSHRLVDTAAPKFSMHIVVHLDGGETMFKNIHHLRVFVEDLVRDLRSSLAEADLGALPDMLVYTRNRLFRTLYSAKYAEPGRVKTPWKLRGVTLEKFLALYRARRDPATAPPTAKALTLREALFYASLVTFVPQCVTVTALVEHGRALLGAKRPHALMTSVLTDDTANEAFLASLAEELASGVDGGFIDGLAMLYLRAPGNAVFGSRSRYCEIRGGHHKSNHVYYVAQLRKKVWYQRCFDEECVAKIRALPGREQSVGDARGVNHYFPMTFWGKITAFLERNKDLLDALPTTDDRPTKRARSDIRFYAAGGVEQTLSAEAILLNLQRDLADLAMDDDDMDV